MAGFLFKNWICVSAGYKTLMEAKSDAEEEEGPDPPPNYGSVEYWNARYQQEPEQFDWYQSWDLLNPVFAPLFTGSETALNIGCGNSTMSYEMTQTTFKKVVSIDISSIVIEQMRQRYSGNDALEWEVMDCSKMTFPDKSFDAVFDKGTIDSLLCGSDPVETVHLTLFEVERVLKPGGLFVLISFGDPASRVKILKEWKLPWHLHKTMVLDDPGSAGSYHYVYIFQKLSSGVSPDMLESGSDYYEEEEEEEESGSS